MQYSIRVATAILAIAIAYLIFILFNSGYYIM